MSKLRAVIRHEYGTIVKQPSFWIMMIAIPVIFAVIFGLVYLSGRASTDRLESLANDIKNVAIIDESGFVPNELVSQSGQQLRSVEQLEDTKADVASGELTGLVYYPGDLEESKKFEVYVNGTDFTQISTVQSLGDSLLQVGIFSPLGSATVIELAQNGGQNELTTYEDGQVSPGFNKYIVPGIFMAMFYLILFFSVGYILTSISEEKENRSMEMALTYLSPRTLIVGKLIGVILVTLTQLAFFAALAALALLVVAPMNIADLQLPAGIDLANLVFDPLTIFFSAGFLVAGFALFAGLMAATAAALPARQANGFSAVFYIAAFAPFYFIQLIMTDPENPVTTFVTYFPLTAPVVTLLRTTVDNMSVLQSSLALIVMVVSAILAMWLAVKIFPKGAIEYNNRISLKSVFSKQ